MGLNRALLLIAATAVVLSCTASGQEPKEKPGSCAPTLGVGICAFTCSSDFECQGAEKCCRTGCGGTACAAPVSRVRAGGETVKKGTCPSEPTGPWICSHMCSSDADCRGRLKCCRNRCGALTCQKPEARR